MPKAFEKCRKGGGKIRTVTKGAAKGRLICIPKGGGKPKLGYKRGHKRGKK